MGGFTQYFLNPAFVTTGLALVASPIIIHLINRMRFRKVRFAAMEFLLQAQQRNRRRLLLEQLLLLLLRILIVLALLALIARLILDPRLTVFGGASKAHHLVVLDDSASMRNKWGATSAFEEAKKVILALVREGAKLPQTQTFSMVLLSKPNEFEFAEVDVSEELVRDLEDKLETLPPSSTRPDLQAGLEIAGQHLRKHEATIKHLHVFSDFRQTDWQGKEALGQVINQLEEDGISINLVRSVEQALPNLGITTLDGDLKAAAAGIPVRLRIGVTNFSEQLAQDVSITVVQDGDKLPLSVTFSKIEPGKEVIQTKDITFVTEGLHQVRVELEKDSLDEDNQRHLSIDIPKQNYVLIVGTDSEAIPEFGLMQALGVSLDLTGIAPTFVQSDFLDKELETRGLNQFRAIYMVNVPSIPAPALPLLEAYVRNGGGLVWFMGDKIRVEAYNELSKLQPNEEGQLARSEEALFPVRLGPAPVEMRVDPTIKTPDLNFASHPIFDEKFDKDNRFLPYLRISSYMPVVKEWVKDDAARKDGTATVGFSRDGDPLVFDHRFGEGRVITFLTSPGPPWNNFVELSRLYVPLIQQVQLYVAKPDEERHSLAIGEKFERTFDAENYESLIQWKRPDLGEPEFTMKAPPAEEGSESEGLWLAEYNDLGQPGIYRYMVMPKSNRRGNDLPSAWEFAVNVAPEEGSMATATDDEIKEHLDPETRVAIHAFGDTEFIGTGTDPGQEIRKYLMYALLFLLVAEQAMAYRLSYHPETVEAPA